MKLVSYLRDGHDQLAFLSEGLLYDCDLLHPDLPNSMNMFLHYWDDLFPIAKQVDAAIKSGRISKEQGIPLEQAHLLAPVPFPTSCRDGYAFRQHVASARRNRKMDMIPEFDQFPVFYFTNHLSVQGPGEITCMPDHFEKLDFELEVAIVIGKEGRDIPAAKADEYIFGFMIMNDWSARTLQMEEMKMNLGPAKGKDFATSLGPYLVTRDELAKYAQSSANGERHDLTMRCIVNAKQVSLGNVKDMSWTFAQIIERVSYGVTLHPGEVIGSGTVGTGCFLELNGSKITDNQWLQDRDEVILEIDGLGKLTNTIKAVD